VRGKISRIVGCESQITGAPIVIEDGEAPVVMLHRFKSSTIYVRTSRTVILESVYAGNIIVQGSGDCFINDFGGDLIINGRSSRVWARQYNGECCRTYDVNEFSNLQVNNGRAWIFGWKSESTGIKGHLYGGICEIIGANMYINGNNKNMAGVPFFLVKNDAQVSCALFHQSGFGGTEYVVLSREIRNGVTKELTGGNNYSLYTAYDPSMVPVAEPSGAIGAPPAPQLRMLSAQRLGISWPERGRVTLTVSNPAGRVAAVRTVVMRGSEECVELPRLCSRGVWFTTASGARHSVSRQFVFGR
jgi:hypothetical protein